MRRHEPIMLAEVIAALPAGCRLVMDGTFGHAGHTAAIAQHILDRGDIPTIIGVDRDDAMIRKGKHFLTKSELDTYVQIVQGSYADLTQIKQQTTIEHVDAILLDIGVNMDHFKEADRGFSIKLDGPLDMRYDRTRGVPAAQMLQDMHYDELVTMLEKWTDFGEKYRTWLAKEWVVVRRKQDLSTTGAVQDRAASLGIHAKKLAIIFQAIRIEVNDELEELELFLQSFTDFLIDKGRCIIITYHSIEDRLVKHAFRQLEDAGKGVRVNKKVIMPHRQEKETNKASRSAKMRIFEKRV